MNPDRLIEMANDIAANLQGGPDAAADLAAHLRKFWAPRMRRQLSEALAADASAALPTVIKAVGQLDADVS